MKFTETVKMIHPWKKLIEEIRNRNWTQKQFAVFVWKKNSEVNELIKWKRNITIQWDLILSEIFWTPEKYWINMQTDYDYEIAKAQRKKERAWQKQDFEIVTEIWSNNESWDDSDVDKVSSNYIVPQNENIWLPWDNIKESWNDEESIPMETQWQSVLQT